MPVLNRRSFLGGLSATVALDSNGSQAQVGWTDYTTMYGAVRGEPFPIPAFQYTQIDPAFLRINVHYSGTEQPGTIVVDPQRRFLYHVQPGGWAVRYGVGVGRQGFSWSGTATIEDKQAWPDWYPPKEMLQRQPDLMERVQRLQSGVGVPGGPGNPLGARALYLWQGNKDTLYRIHGTLEPWTIGQSVSSGCIRMINQDVIDLYNRTPVGTQVVVLGTPSRTQRRVS
jgi:lipoprotein-anchoring transpeptidase ErfK/SrfK